MLSGVLGEARREAEVEGKKVLREECKRRVAAEVFVEVEGRRGKAGKQLEWDKSAGQR